MTSHKEGSTSTLKPFVELLTAENAIGHANLTLVPLRGEVTGTLSYILGVDALEAGTLEVTEISESGSVPELLAVTVGDQMVLLLDGEELVGAKQNRILNTSVLLRPQSKTPIPVSCVEQGRWRHTSAGFASGAYSPAMLRGHKSAAVRRNLSRKGKAESVHARQDRASRSRRGSSAI